MHPQDLLPTLAEMAITFLGFTGILVALRPASVGPWSKPELFRIRAVLLIPGLVTVTAVLPFGLSGFSESPSIVWGVPLVFYGLTTSALQAHTFFALRRRDFPLIHSAFAFPLLVASTVASILAVLSGLGAVMPFSAGLLVLALCWSLVTTAAIFILTLVFWAKTSAGQQIAPADAAERRRQQPGERE